MSLTRAQLVAVLAGEVEQAYSLASLPLTDTTGALKEPVDRTYRELGTAEADIATAEVSTGGERRAIAFATYYAIRRAWYAVVDVAINVSSGGSSLSLNQDFTNLKALLDEAREEAQRFGLSTGDDAGVAALAYGGGIDVTDYDTIDDDTSQMEKMFTLERIRLPGFPFPAEVAE